MHHAAHVGQVIQDSSAYGWTRTERVKHDWSAMVERVQSYIKQQNFKCRAELLENNVVYYNAHARFVDSHTLVLKDSKGITQTITANQIVLSTGCRPRYPDIIGAEHILTSDDIFSHAASPGKTLVVGGSHVALECAGFISGTGCNTTVMMRSIPLRGFDHQMAKMVKNDMTERGVTFIVGCTPSRIDLLEDKRLLVHWNNTSNVLQQDTFDTVLYAIGRQATTDSLDLNNAGITVDSSGKIPTRNNQTNVSHVYAIGDVCLESGSSDIKLELTPLAVQAGKLLADRLYARGTRNLKLDLIPTAVYTPMEYAFVGMSEEDAVATYGKDQLRIFHSRFIPLNNQLVDNITGSAYVKLICATMDDDRVVGLHFCGPDAGEVVQGFALAMRCGATKRDFDETIGVHPTTAEQLLALDALKSDDNPIQAVKCGCWG